MTFLADENFPRPALLALREAGLSVLSIAEMCPAALDPDVLALCGEKQCTLLTFDKDFGELAYHRGLPAGCGVVLFRLTPQDADEVASIALAALRSEVDWRGHFSVIDRKRVRVRPLPEV